MQGSLLIHFLLMLKVLIFYFLPVRLPSGTTGGGKLKAGHDLESWQQETGLAIAKRLLVDSMACVVISEIAAAKGEKAQALRTF